MKGEKMIEKIISTVVGACISMFGWVSDLFKPTLPVTDATTALTIGKKVAQEKYPNIDYNSYAVQVYDHYLRDDNRWVVSYELVDGNGRIMDNILGGGGPEIHIRKTDGKILYTGIQR